MTPDKESSEDWLGQKIKDTVEHSLGIWCNDVATLTDGPSDRVQDPEESSQRAAVLELHVSTPQIDAPGTTSYQERISNIFP